MKSRNRKAARAIAGCCLGVFWFGAVAFGYPGVMSTYWQERFSVGAGETGAVVTFMLLGLAVCMFFSGRIHMRIGMRGCAALGIGMAVVAMTVLIQARSMAGVYLWAFLMNAGGSFLYGPGLTTAQQWLPHRRGLASGLLNLVFGLSAAIMSPVWNRMLDAVGYEMVNYILVACILVSNTIALFLTEGPDRTALTEEERMAQQTLMEGMARKDGGLTPRQALGTRTFWLIWFLWVFMGAAGVSMISLSKSYALSLGLSGVVILTAFNITNGVGRLIAGMLCDRIGGEWTGISAFLLAAVGYLLLPHVRSVAVLAILAACVGYGFGTLFTVTGPITTERFGMKYFGAIFGAVFTAYGFVGGILGPALSGLVLDLTGGNYRIVFSYLALFALVGAGLMALLKRERAENS